MFKTIVITIVALFITLSAYAEIPVYCPKCKRHIYDYQGEVVIGTIMLAKDFKPTRYSGLPQESDPFKCPVCKASLNGWEYYGEYNKVKDHRNACGAVSILTKVDDKFKWVPYHVPNTGVDE